MRGWNSWNFMKNIIIHAHNARNTNNENNLFNIIIKKLIHINIFDLSRISYLMIIFLSPYIDHYLQHVLNNDKEISIIINEDSAKPILPINKIINQL